MVRESGLLPKPGRRLPPPREAQPQSAPPSWFLRYGNLLDAMIAKQEENSTKMTELSDQIDTKEHNHVWKKEGLKRQNEVAEKVLKKSKAAVASIDLGHTDRAPPIHQ